MLFTCANCHEELLAVSSKKPWVLEGVRVKVSEACLHNYTTITIPSAQSHEIHKERTVKAASKKTKLTPRWQLLFEDDVCWSW